MGRAAVLGSNVTVPEAAGYPALKSPRQGPRGASRGMCPEALSVAGEGEMSRRVGFIQLLTLSLKKYPSVLEEIQIQPGQGQ